ncbi:uncharacterized protein TRUGW13939_09602 [Talaromyces rugulosus]|uniref:Carrier domain-containing protein n=1 Tax=Talaromyces rugulosus TaxID=121627 RepID=A0A7H8R9L8_TALRU|nr:uncharacterized protein TRUGW13939_09602 [Talaromyces rugulosus]QKX62441.1 hypothetical protein TRUGW13939_09602 [Talaromyces rugulosus]
MSEPPTIFNSAIACREIFRTATKFSRLMRQEWAENRLADFNLWTAGSGASTTGKTSLDHRLQANQETHIIIVNLLCMLRILIEKCIKEASATEENASELSSGELSRIKDVEDSLNQLSRLTVAIRKAGVRSRLQKAESSFNPENSQISSLRRHLELLLLIHPEKHGSSESSRNQLDAARLTPIQSRLIDANLKRRNRFLYAQRHAQKLEINSKKQDDRPSAPVVVVKSQQPQQEIILTENPRAQSTTTATVVDEQILIPPKAASTTTVVSVTSSRISYPKPPPIHDDQIIFTCPCCCQSLPTTVARGSHWKKHLMGDILPYTCIFEDCAQADKFYNTKATWLNHMEMEHGGSEQWVCLACSQKSLNVTFREPVDFTAHLEQEHSKIKPQQIPMLLSTWRRKVPLKISACPLCGFEDNDQNFVLDHVAEHIHSFSLRSLPLPPGEGIEEDRDEGEEDYSSYFKQYPYFDVDSSRSELSSSLSKRSSLGTDTGSFAGFNYREADSSDYQQEELMEYFLEIPSLARISDEPESSLRTLQIMIDLGADSAELVKICVEVLSAQFSKILQLGDEVDPGKPLTAYGIDSLEGMELQHWIRHNMEVELLTFDIINENSLITLSEKIVSKLLK